MKENLILCKSCGEEIARDAKTCPKCGAKNKRKRPVLGVILVILGIGLIAAAFGGGDSNSTPSPAPTVSATESAAAPESPIIETVTLEEFEAITSGMTYDEVVETVGFEGTLSSQVDLNVGEEYKSELYTWVNPLGSNMNVTFQGGVVVSKAQFGLK